MNSTAYVPDAGNVKRYKNLSLDFWAPPSQAVLATQEFRSRLLAFIESATHTYLLGFSSGRVLPELEQHQNSGIGPLAASAQPSELGRSFTVMPKSVFISSIETILPGTLNLTRKQLNTFGVHETVRTHVGTPLLLVPLDAVERIFCMSPTSGAVLQSISVVTNPLVGVPQQQAKDLRSAVQQFDRVGFVMWLAAGSSFILLAAEGQLLAFRNNVNSTLNTLNPSERGV